MQKAMFGSATTSVQPAPTKPWTVPRGLSGIYMARVDIEQYLDRIFKRDVEDPSSPRVFFISGMGGSGKTELCISYATKYRERYWGVFWIDCSTESTAEDSFQNIAHICNIPNSGSAGVKNYLSSIENTWLMILDNANEPSMKLEKYRPSGGKGDIIITTRNQNLCPYDAVGSAHLPPLEAAHAKCLLMSAANIPVENWTKNMKAAEGVVDQLGRHILAIVQAGAFIRQYSYSLENYSQLLKSQKSEMFGISALQDHDTSVTATFEISVQKLSEAADSGHRAAQSALTLMSLLCFWENNSPVEAMLIEASKYLQAHKHDPESEDFVYFPLCAMRPIYFFPKPNDASAALAWRQACKPLVELSLIHVRQREGDGETIIEMHPLAYEWAKTRMKKSNQAFCWMAAASTVALAGKQCIKYQENYLEYPHYMPFPKRDMVLDHMCACIRGFSKDYLPWIVDPRVVEVLYCLNLRFTVSKRYCWYSFKVTRALTQYIEFNKLPGRDKPAPGAHKTLGALFDSNITDKYCSPFSKSEQHLYLVFIAGKERLAAAIWDQALELLQEVIESGSDCPDRLMHWTRREVVRAHWLGWQLEDGFQLLRKAIASLPDDKLEHILRYKEQLGRLLLIEQKWDRRRLGESIEVLEFVVKHLRLKFTEDTPRLIDVEASLGEAYLHDYQFEKARQIFESVIKRVEKTFPDGHPSMKEFRTFREAATKKRSLPLPWEEMDGEFAREMWDGDDAKEMAAKRAGVERHRVPPLYEFYEYYEYVEGHLIPLAVTDDVEMCDSETDDSEMDDTLGDDAKMDDAKVDNARGFGGSGEAV